MTGLVGLVQHQGISLLPIEASNVLLLLHQPENIKNWDPKDPMAAFWDVSGQVGVVVGVILLFVWHGHCMYFCSEYLYTCTYHLYLLYLGRAFLFFGIDGSF